jgi:hypothetical protein
MTFRQWLRKVFGPRAQGLRASRRDKSRLPSRYRFVPCVEPLEDRLAPATITVLTTGDGSGVFTGGANPTDTTLRGAIANASPGDTIQFQSGLAGTINLNTAGGGIGTALSITENLTIQGPTGTSITVEGGTVAHLTTNIQVFTVSVGVTASISGLTIANGTATNTTNGGGIANFGNLTLQNCTLSGNLASNTLASASGGGGIYNGRTYSSVTYSFIYATLTVQNCTLSGNSATGIGSGGGGGIDNWGTLTVQNSTLSGNLTSATGGGIGNHGVMTVQNSTLSGNMAPGSGRGGGIFNSDNLTLLNCTLSGNSAAAGGGIYNLGTLTVQNCTLSGNSASTSNGGGGIDNNIPFSAPVYPSAPPYGATESGSTVTITTVNPHGFVLNEPVTIIGVGVAGYDGTFTITNYTPTTFSYTDPTTGLAPSGGGTATVGSLSLTNTILSHNTANSAFNDIVNSSGPVNASNCLFFTSPTTGAGGTINGTNTNNLFGTNPLLGPLQNNGGPTQTMALGAGSPAINNGSNAALTLGTLTGISVSWTASTGGSLAHSTSYYYQVSAINPQGETTASAEMGVAVLGTTNTNTVTVGWNPVSGATGYKIYGRTSGGELLLATVSAAATFYTDDGSVTPSGLPPMSNTTTLTTDQRGAGYARISNGTVDIGAFEVVDFTDNFNATGSLSSNWQVQQKFLYTYRRRLGIGSGFTENNKAISSGAGFDAEEVVGPPLLNPQLIAQVDASQALAAGLIARIQSNDNAYVAVLTNSGQAQIWLFNADSYTVLASTNAGTNAGTLAFTITGDTTPTLSLYLNGSSTPLLTVTPTGSNILAGAGGVGIFAWGANGSIDNFSVSGS